MHNVLTRVQNVFGFFTTVASTLACVIAVIGFMTTPIASLDKGAVQMRNVQVTMGRPHYYSRQKEEYAHITFDLDVELKDLYTWNTKQVFVYMTATYPPTDKASSTLSATEPDNTAIIWDAVLPHPLAPKHHNQYTYPVQTKASSSKGSKTPKSKPKPHVEIVPGLLRLDGQKPKYQLTSPTAKLAARNNATIALNYNIQPWVGALTWASGTLAPERAAWWSTWQALPNARSAQFALPARKNETEARRAAGKDGLGVAKGDEAYRGRPVGG